MSSFDSIAVYEKDRINFKSIMEELISRGFFYSNLVNQESRKNGIVGYFLKAR